MLHVRACQRSDNFRAGRCALPVRRWALQRVATGAQRKFMEGACFAPENEYLAAAFVPIAVHVCTRRCSLGAGWTTRGAVHAAVGIEIVKSRLRPELHRPPAGKRGQRFSGGLKVIIGFEMQERVGPRTSPQIPVAIIHVQRMTTAGVTGDVFARKDQNTFIYYVQVRSKPPTQFVGNIQTFTIKIKKDNSIIFKKVF